MITREEVNTVLGKIEVGAYLFTTDRRTLFSYIEQQAKQIERLRGLLGEAESLLKRSTANCLNESIAEHRKDKDQFFAKLDDIDTAQPAPLMVRGKRLAWEEEDNDIWQAKIGFGVFLRIFRISRVFLWNGNSYETLESAQAAAQAWHDEQLAKWVEFFRPQLPWKNRDEFLQWLRDTGRYLFPEEFEEETLLLQDVAETAFEQAMKGTD